MCKHTKLKLLLTSITLQQIREAGVVTTQEHISMLHDIECTCKIKRYTICMLSKSILGIVVFIILNARKLKLFRGHLFSNAAKIMLFISGPQDYVLVKLCRTAGSIYLFKITGTLIPEHIKLKRNILWNIIEIDWKEVKYQINLPSSVIIPLWDKFKISIV